MSCEQGGDRPRPDGVVLALEKGRHLGTTRRGRGGVAVRGNEVEDSSDRFLCRPNPRAIRDGSTAVRVNQAERVHGSADIDSLGPEVELLMYPPTRSLAE